jgi:deoxyribodipyrimidine photo-lyase
MLHLNSHQIKNGPILYWMNREMRTEDNWSLLYAQQLSIKNKVPLIVVYNLVPTFLGAQRRQLAFKIASLRQIREKLKEKNIHFSIFIDSDGTQSGKHIVDFSHTISAGAVITDFNPLRIARLWNEHVREYVSVAFMCVDSHNIIPAWITSEKKEFAAYTIRPKIHKYINDYFDEFPKLLPSEHTLEYPEFNTVIDEMMGDEEINTLLSPLSWAPPGEQGAHTLFKKFLQNGIHSYHINRNNPNEEGQSNLSPYLHYGMIAPQRVAQEIVSLVGKPISEILHRNKNKASITSNSDISLLDNAGAFLEELIVRRELSDNFCFYDEKYDSTESFPEWAKKSLEKTKYDKREFLYTHEEFEKGKTHDDLWNAAQLQMVITGKMHGYMRMYWAKKILEWTPSVEEALKIAINLNDTYELDGRDPNGYAGIAWCIGGVHDRAWFPRPVFGLIRTMTRSGCEKKFDTKTYINTWLARRDSYLST